MSKSSSALPTPTFNISLLVCYIQHSASDLHRWQIRIYPHSTKNALPVRCSPTGTNGLLVRLRMPLPPRPQLISTLTSARRHAHA